MSWLKKIVSAISSGGAEQPAAEALRAMPGEQCLTAEAASAGEPAAEEDEENPTKQRRYFVKKGLFVDHEDEVTNLRSAQAVKEISDRRPVDLKALFAKLSL
jgi:hypothetical protein